MTNTEVQSLAVGDIVRKGNGKTHYQVIGIQGFIKADGTVSQYVAVVYATTKVTARTRSTWQPARLYSRIA